MPVPLRKVSMLMRRSSKSPSEATPGRPQLTLAKIILLIEATVRYFARPLFFAVLFLSLSWMGIFTALYPWAHLAALALFIILFFDALGRSHILWRRPSLSLAMRRVEEASGLKHRPMDVLKDRPVGTAPDAHTLWQAHVLRARTEMRKLRWPEFKMNLAARDPYRLRYVAAVLLTLGLITGWGALGGRLIAAINPALGKIPLSTTTVDAWITPPEYTHLPPIMIATPAGDRYQNEVIKVPEGSVLHAHLAEKDGDTPVLEANNQSVEFAAEDEKDFGVTVPLTAGNTVAIRRGWMTLGSWKVQVVPDTGPQIAFSEAPSASERKDVRVAYDAKDDYGVTSITLRVTPREALFGISADPIELPLATLDEKEVKRVDFKDLTAQPWAGMLVDMQLVATDAAGHKTETDKVAYTLPERVFFQPVARMLIEERKKLLTNMFNSDVRSEVANLMAGLAHQPAAFGSDPAVMMSLRAGAVRLVLDHDREAALSAKDILWQTATRIEDGVMGVAEQNLKQAQKELADALDRNASEKEVQALIDRLHQALAQYLAQISTRIASHPAIPEDLGQILGSRTNQLTPQDLEKMLNDMRGLSATGSREAARQELAKMNEALENLTTSAPQLTKEQQAAVDNFKSLQKLAHEQQALLDKTFQKTQKADDKQQKDQKDQDTHQKQGSAGDDKQKPEDQKQKSQANKGGNDSESLASQQGELRLQMKELAAKSKGDKNMSAGVDAMAEAEKSLKRGAPAEAVPSQSEALKLMRQAQQDAAKTLQLSLKGTPIFGMGMADSDPFGREDGHSMESDNLKHQVPDHFEVLRVREIINEIQHRASDLTRSKTEHDYIERLLQNF